MIQKKLGYLKDKKYMKKKINYILYFFIYFLSSSLTNLSASSTDYKHYALWGGVIFATSSILYLTYLKNKNSNLKKKNTAMKKKLIIDQKNNRSLKNIFNNLRKRISDPNATDDEDTEELIQKNNEILNQINNSNNNNNKSFCQLI